MKFVTWKILKISRKSRKFKKNLLVKADIKTDNKDRQSSYSKKKNILYGSLQTLRQASGTDEAGDDSFELDRSWCSIHLAEWGE